MADDIVAGIGNMQMAYGVDTDAGQYAQLLCTGKCVVTTALMFQVVSVRVNMPIKGSDDNVTSYGHYPIPSMDNHFQQSIVDCDANLTQYN